MAGKMEFVRGACSTSTGTQDFTISGFGTPTAAIIFVTGETVLTLGPFPESDSMVSIGFTDGTRSRCIAAWSRDAQANMEAATCASDELITMMSNGKAVDARAVFDSWITDGIRIDWTDAAGAADLLTVVLISSDSAYVGDVAVTSTLENVTDPGFEPTTVFAISGWEVDFTTAPSPADDHTFTFGICVNSGGVTQISHNMWDEDALATSDPGVCMSNTRIVQEVDGSSLGDYLSLGSFDSSGFSVSKTPAAATKYLGYLALDMDVDQSLSTETMPTSTGNTDFTNPGFEPVFGFFMRGHDVDVNTFENNAAAFSMWLLDGSDDHTLGFGIQNNASTSNTWSHSQNDLGGLFPNKSVNWTGTFSSWISTGVQLNFTKVDTSSGKEGCLYALGPAAAGNDLIYGEGLFSLTGSGVMQASGTLAGESSLILTGDGYVFDVTAEIPGPLSGESMMALYGDGAALGRGGLAGEATLVLTGESTAQGLASISGEASIVFYSGVSVPVVIGDLVGESLISLLALGRARTHTVHDRTVTVRVPIQVEAGNKIRVMVQRTDGTDPLRLLDDSGVSVEGS